MASGKGDGFESVDYYQERIRQLDDKALESSRRSAQTLQETIRIGADTMVELDEQGEKLNRAERRLDDIDQDLRTSQRTIREIRSVFGGVVNWFSKDKLSTTPSHVGQAKDEKALEAARLSQSSAASAQATRSQPLRQQRQQQQQKHSSAREQELDQNLSSMSDSLSALRHMGQDMGNTLETQNQQIDRMSGRVLTLDDKVQDLRTQTRKML